MTGKTKMTIKDALNNLDEITNMVKKQATIADIASFFGVSKTSFYDWMSKEPIISDTITQARRTAVLDVKAALYREATGYERENKKIIQEKDKDGKIKQRTEIIKVFQGGDPRAIAMYLRNYDTEFSDVDLQLKKIREQDALIKKLLAENELLKKINIEEDKDDKGVKGI